MTPATLPFSIHKPRILALMDRKSRDWGTVLKARALLRTPDATANPAEFVRRSIEIGYTLTEPEKDLLHLVNDWAGADGRGWFGDAFQQILGIFRDALDRVGEHGPHLDCWWVHGALPDGSNPAIVPYFETLDRHGLHQVSLFLFTVKIPAGAWPYGDRPGGAERSAEDLAKALQSK